MKSWIRQQKKSIDYTKISYYLTFLLNRLFIWTMACTQQSLLETKQTNAQTQYETYILTEETRRKLHRRRKEWRNIVKQSDRSVTCNSNATIWFSRNFNSWRLFGSSVSVTEKVDCLDKIFSFLINKNFYTDIVFKQRPQSANHFTNENPMSAACWSLEEQLLRFCFFFSLRTRFLASLINSVSPPYSTQLEYILIVRNCFGESWRTGEFKATWFWKELFFVNFIQFSFVAFSWQD